MKKRRVNFNHWLVFQQKTSSGRGIDRTETWSDHFGAWGFVRPVSASEKIRSGRDEMTTTHRIRLRSNATVGHQHRIKFGSRIFEVESVINIDEASRETELLAREVL